MTTIRVVGFSGIADIIWVAATKTMLDKFSAGEICAGILLNLKRTACEAISYAVRDSARRYSTGLMIHGQCDE